MPRMPLFALAPIIVLFGLCPPAQASEVPISPAALRVDLEKVLSEVRRTHPALSSVVDEHALVSEVDRIERKIDKIDQPLSRTEAWALLTRLNPFLADGHLLIGLPGWRGEAAQVIERGEGLFPFEIELDGDGSPRIAAALGGEPHRLAGVRIRRINGLDANEVAAAMLARAHGDTPKMRRALVSERWWFFYRMLHGTPQHFDLVLGDASTRSTRVAAGSVLPAAIAREDNFAANFVCRLERDGRALLRLGSFGWPDKSRFLAFTQDCFAAMRAAGTTRLLIDVRANGGGNDDMWIEGIMPYVATKPWRTGSTFLKRVIEDDPEEGETAGEIVAGENDMRDAPTADAPTAFRGKIEVRIGPMTYSSAVLFANVMRDFGLARLCGSGDAVRTRQTGGVRALTLPASGFFLSYPRFILDPPAGEAAPARLQAEGSCDFAG